MERADRPVPPAIVSDNAIAVLEEEQHLRVSIIGRQGPAMTERDGLPLPRVRVVRLSGQAQTAMVLSRVEATRAFLTAKR